MLECPLRVRSQPRIIIITITRPFPDLLSPCPTCPLCVYIYYYYYTTRRAEGRMPTFLKKIFDERIFRIVYILFRRETELQFFVRLLLFSKKERILSIREADVSRIYIADLKNNLYHRAIFHRRLNARRGGRYNEWTRVLTPA